jgi:hypothetical protein
MSFYLRETQNSLEPEVCREIIKRFEEDPRKREGLVAGGYFPEVKSSTDLMITALDGWEDLDPILWKSLAAGIATYNEEVIGPCNHVMEDPKDSGYQVQRTLPGGFYTWHNDNCTMGGAPSYLRDLTFIWYLNTIEYGGTTEFVTGEHVKPEEGKLLIFPATWAFAHRGNPPEKETKYICTGWVYSNYARYY